MLVQSTVQRPNVAKDYVTKVHKAKQNNKPSKDKVFIPLSLCTAAAIINFGL